MTFKKTEPFILSSSKKHYEVEEMSGNIINITCQVI